MKTKTLMAAAMLLFSSSAFAQFTSSSSSSDISSGWNDVYVQYNIMKNGALSDVSKVDDDYDWIPSSINGFTVGYNRAISLTSSIPLYLLVGGAFEYNFKSADKSESYEDTYYPYKLSEELKGKTFSLKVPVSVTYHFDLGDKFALEPFAGLNLRYYFSASSSRKRSYTYTSSSGESLHGSETKDYDAFNKEDVDKTANRFLIGCQIGVTAVIAKKFTATISYDRDLSKVHDYFDDKCYRFNFGLGYRF